MKRRSLSALMLALAMALFLTTACAKKPAPEIPAAPPATTEAPAVPEKQPADERAGVPEERIVEAPVAERPTTEMPAAAAPAAVAELQRIFFDYNQFTLTPQAQETLANNAAYLKSRPNIKVSIEGHCDERGSDEYNLALGERRAGAARDYLVSLGIAPERLSVISYGEERPLVAASNEEAWAKNRRAEFTVR